MISIIIPTLNEEKIIEKTLKHLRSIKNFPVEIIVYDEKSTDQTVEIARQYADQALEYRGADKPTIAYGRNGGAKASKGEFLLFHDASTYIPEPDNFLKKVMEKFENDPALSAVTGSVRVQKDLETWRDRFFWTMINFTYYLNNNVWRIGTANGKFQFMRREAFEKVGGYDASLVTYEDNDLYERIAKIGKTRMIPELTVFQPGRREHAMGWARMLSLWMVETISFKLRKKSVSKEWKPIR